MSFEPGRANASSVAHPVAEEDVQIISAEQPVDPAAQPVQNPCSGGLWDVRWQVERPWGQWWDIPQSAAIECFYKALAPGVTYTYDWGNGRISCYELYFARREQVTIGTHRVRRVRRVLVATSVQGLS